MNHACFWTVYMLGCETIQVRNITIKTSPIVPNADGLHLNCCRNVIVSDCDIDSQDDCLIFRGHYTSLLPENMACENITVTNSILRTRCCAIRIGEGDGIIRNCLFSNLVMHNTRHGINIMPAYSERYPRGTDIDNIAFHNITMDVAIPIYINNLGSADVKNISFSGIRANMTQTCYIKGEQENYLSSVNGCDCIFRYTADKNLFDFDANDDSQPKNYNPIINPPASGIFMQYCNDLNIQNTSMIWGKYKSRRVAAICCISCESPKFKNLDTGNFANITASEVKFTQTNNAIIE